MNTFLLGRTELKADKENVTRATSNRVSNFLGGKITQVLTFSIEGSHHETG